MLWFGGSIENAVDKVKSSGVTLLIFVQGNDALSDAYDIILNEKTNLKSQECIALKIPAASLMFRQFKQIYYSVPVPSIFLINNNGRPLKIVSSKNTSDVLIAISDIFGNPGNIVISKGENEVKSHKDQINDCSDFKSQEPGWTSPKSSYAKNIGYKVFDITEDEIKQRLSEIRSFPRFLLINNPPPFIPDPSTLPHPMSKVQSARIQFRLPNNDLPSWEFPDLSTLSDVRAYLMEKADLSPNFKLLQACPRRGFTPQDEHKTLVDLALTPNATLIVIPVEDKTVQAKVKNIVAHKNFVSLVMQTLLQPFLILINYFKKHVLKIPNQNKNRKPSRLISNTALGKTLNKKTSTENFCDYYFEGEGEEKKNADSQSESSDVVTSTK